MPTILRFGAFEVDLAAGRLLKRGVRVNLRRQSFDVLASLLENRRRIAGRCHQRANSLSRRTALGKASCAAMVNWL